MDYKLISKKNKRYLLVPRLVELGLKHCFTTIDMDMGTKTNRSIENIRENFENIYEFLGIEPKLLYSGQQVHSNRVEIVEEKYQGEENPFGRHIKHTDGLITSQRDIGLITRYADCIPILIFDPVKKVQANIHSGWKGTLGKIGIKGLSLMEEKYGSKAEDLIVVLGPSINKEDFEVERDVMEDFKKNFEFYEEVIVQKNKIKYLIDLQEINRRLFESKGVKGKNIITIDLSTYSTPYLHSYRRDKENFGLMGVISYIK